MIEMFFEHPVLVAVALYLGLVVIKTGVTMQSMVEVALAHVALGKVNIEQLPEEWSEKRKLKTWIWFYIVGGVMSIIFTLPRILLVERSRFFVPRTRKESLYFAEHEAWEHARPGQT